jgi:Domain of unknown function (DUF4340)
MQKTIGVLTVLLGAQLLLAVAMSYTGPDLTAVRPDTPLISLGDSSVDRVIIDGSDKKQIVLEKQGTAWVLPGSGGFPADKAKVDLLLDHLKGLKRGFAVATTGSAQKRFKVSDDDFERRVVLDEGDRTLATVYFGTSPGLRRVHARTSQDDAVYTTGFGLYDAPLRVDDWEDKTVLHMPPGDIRQIDLAAITLRRVAQPQAADAAAAGGAQQGAKTAATAWSSDSLKQGETVDQAGADALAEKLAALDIGSVLGSESKPEYGLTTPKLDIKVQRKGGEVVDYRLGKRDGQNDYVLKVSSRPEYFRLPAYAADALIKAAGPGKLVTAANDTGAKDTPAPDRVANQSAVGAAATTGGAAAGGKL